MKKRLIAFVLSMVMLLGMAMPTMAAEAEVDENGEAVYFEAMDNLVQPRWS